uniref:ATP synthase subunit a n=1 Tax=Ophiomastix mixta TaxID=2705303 RepID=A0A6C0FCK5_9ECHI|nr:ATP synthase F0 subunit 6 [Ophiomastix mixta]QHT54186.1 ATP synthase F0 subunit 6 [Ophiomastix mixta]
MNTITNIFSQFMPVNFVLPLSLVGALIALSWTLTINNTHFLPRRTHLLNKLIFLTSSTLLETQTNSQSKWGNWIFTLFILCITLNLLSLIPYTFSQTSHFSTTFSLSWPIWLAIQTTGLLTNWKAKLAHLVPQGTPTPLIPIMVLIETISLLIQPLTLGFRLGANLLSGHLLIFLCSCVVWNCIYTSNIGILSFILLFLLLILEIAVACIQATVFFILSKIYLEENLT